MTVMVQIRNMPEATHRTLKARAAGAGMSLSDYLLREVEAIAALPTVQEWVERMQTREPLYLEESPADTIRAMRDGR